MELFVIEIHEHVNHQEVMMIMVLSMHVKLNVKTVEMMVFVT